MGILSFVDIINEYETIEKYERYYAGINRKMSKHLENHHPAHGQTLSSLPTYTLTLVLSVAKLCTNAGCVLAYIPSLVGGASVWVAVLRKGYPRDVCRGYSLHYSFCRNCRFGQAEEDI